MPEIFVISIIRQQFLFTFSASFCFLVAIFNLIILQIAGRHPFTILKSGIELHGVELPWDRVALCRWTRYTRGILSITTMDLGQAFLSGFRLAAAPPSRQLYEISPSGTIKGARM
jgi:hypothetical protein